MKCQISSPHGRAYNAVRKKKLIRIKAQATIYEYCGYFSGI